MSVYIAFARTSWVYTAVQDARILWIMMGFGGMGNIGYLQFSLGISIK